MNLSDSLAKKIVMHNDSPCPGAEELMNYKLDLLSPRDRRRIEEHLLDCPLCAQIEDHVTSPDFQLHLRSLNRRIEAAYGRKITRKLTPQFYYYAAAAVVIVALSALTFKAFRNPYAPVFADNYQPYPNTTPITRGQGNHADLETALMNYELGRYDEAIAGFEKLLPSDDERVLFYLALSFVSTGQSENAITHLEKVAANIQNKLAEPAEWYTGLAYLQLNQPAKAKTIFESIQAKQSAFSQKARQVIEQME